jgi:hypothetical protein
MKLKRKNEEAISLNSVTVGDTSQRIGWLVRGIGSLIVGILKLPLRFLYYLFNGRVPKFENTRQEEAFWRVKRRYRRKFFLNLHSTIFALTVLFAILAAAIRWFEVGYATASMTEDLLWFYFRNDLIAGVLALAAWFILVSVHAVIVRTAQNEDDELEQVMAREYERTEHEVAQPDYGKTQLVQDDGEIDFEFEAAKAKRNYRQKP